MFAASGHRVSSPDVLSQRHLGGVMRNMSCPETPTRQFHRTVSARSAQSEPATPHTHQTDTGEGKTKSKTKNVKGKENQSHHPKNFGRR